MTAKPKHQTEIQHSPETAYLAGVYFGDGTIYHYIVKNSHGNTHYVRWMFGLTVKDKEFRDKVATILSHIVKNSTYNRIVNGYYRCEVPCKKLYDYLNKPITEHDELIQKYPDEFLRGFFDSEGGVYFESATNVFRVRAYNTDINVLNYIATIMKQKYQIASPAIWVNVKKGRPCAKEKKNGKQAITTKDCYCLQIVRRTDVQKFMDNVGFSITRKNNVWKNNLEAC